MRAARLIRMALLLQSSPGLSAADLGRELGVSRRTVIRDAQALREAGLPVRAEQGRAGGYRLAPGYRTRLTMLDPAEAGTLYLSGLPAALRDLGLADAADAARLKLSAMLLPSLRAAAQSSADRFHLDAPAWFRAPSAPGLLPDLARAVWSDRAVELAYDRPGGQRAAPGTAGRVLEPYGLVLKAGVWYVVGRVRGGALRRHGGGAWRTYRVDRVTSLSLLPDPDGVFVRDPSFDLAAHWRADADRFTRALLRSTVTVRVTRRGLALLPSAVDPAGTGSVSGESAGLVPAGDRTPDAAGRVTLEVPVESEDVAFGQLLSLGADVEVLAPATLRARFRAYAHDLAARYEPAPDPVPGTAPDPVPGPASGSGLRWDPVPVQDPGPG